MNYIQEESKVVYRSKGDKKEKTFDTLEWPRIKHRDASTGCHACRAEALAKAGVYTCQTGESRPTSLYWPMATTAEMVRYGACPAVTCGSHYSNLHLSTSQLHASDNLSRALRP